MVILDITWPVVSSANMGHEGEECPENMLKYRMGLERLTLI